MTKSEIQFLDAALAGDVRSIKKGLAAGIRVDVRDPRGTPWDRTALMHSAGRGHLNVVNTLLHAGADVNVKDKGVPSDVPGGNTPLLLALSGPQTDGSPAHVKIAHMLLDAGANANAKGGGSSVIAAAAYVGDAKLFRRIVELGADIYQVDSSGRTPMSTAVAAGSVEIVSFLLRHGLDPNSRTPGGTPVLVDSALEGSPNHLQICKALIKAGADPNLGRVNNFTPLMAACRCGHLEIAKYLLSIPVSVNEIEKTERVTALDIVTDLLQSRNPHEEVLAKSEEAIDSLGPSLQRLKSLEKLLRSAGGKTAVDLLAQGKRRARQ
jgi:ankyrin repeat protein